MNKSLYQITNELQSTMDEIIENGGEVDEAIEEQLAISESELREKAESYCNVITMMNGDIECCKNEKKRINDIQNTKKNLVEKLKQSLLDAVLKFGDEGKSNNKILNLSIYKLFTKSTKSINVNEERLATLSYYVKEYFIELYKNGILNIGDNVDLSGMVAAINAIVKADKGEDYPLFTLKDLTCLNFDFKINASFSDLLQPNGRELIGFMINNISETETTIDKDRAKEVTATMPADYYTVFAEVDNKSLTIK